MAFSEGWDRSWCRQSGIFLIEAKGVEISRSLVHEADVVLYLIDSSAGMNDEDREFIENCRAPLIVVWNKCDKDSTIVPQVFEENLVSSRSERHPEPVEGQLIEAYISAKTGSGLSELFNQIEALLTQGLDTEREQAGLGSARQKDAVAEALERVQHALVAASDNYSLDAVVQDLEDALDALSEVTGAITPDDILGSIFANFCVGK